MSKILQFKTGSSGVFEITYANDDGSVIDITGYSIDMDFYNIETDVLIISTSVGSGITLTDAANGEFEVDAGATIAWPIGKMPIDIKYTPGSGEAQHTETFYIDVQKGISQ